MSDSIDIKHVETLSDMKSALRRFGHEVEGSLTLLEMAMRKTLDDLQRKLIAAQGHLDRCTDNVSYAQRAIEDCEAQEDEDYQPDCSDEYNDLEWTRRERRGAEQRLGETRKWLFGVEKQIDDYRGMAASLKRVATSRIGLAASLIQHKIGDIEKYMSVSAEPGHVSYISTDGDSYLADPQGGVSTVMAGVANNQVENTYSGSDKGWAELGIRDVDVDRLPNVEEISDRDDFNKVPMKDMEKGLQRYLEIRKVLDSGKGYSKEYWREVDRKKGLAYPDGYQRIYESFYGREPIRITKDGNSYTIENGRHRLWLAKRMGIKTLPASIVERKGV